MESTRAAPFLLRGLLRRLSAPLYLPVQAPSGGVPQHSCELAPTSPTLPPGLEVSFSHCFGSTSKYVSWSLAVFSL